jgi:hypothetical protein
MKTTWVVSENGDFMEIDRKARDHLRANNIIYYCRHCREYHINTEYDKDRVGHPEGFRWTDVRPLEATMTPKEILKEIEINRDKIEAARKEYEKLLKKDMDLRMEFVRLHNSEG